MSDDMKAHEGVVLVQHANNVRDISIARGHLTRLRDLISELLSALDNDHDGKALDKSKAILRALDDEDMSMHADLLIDALSERADIEKLMRKHGYSHMLRQA